MDELIGFVMLVFFLFVFVFILGLVKNPDANSKLKDSAAKIILEVKSFSEDVESRVDSLRRAR